MHFKNGFKDENAERYMLLTRIQKLVSMIRSEYYYDGYADPGTLESLDGLYSYEEAMGEACADRWRVFYGRKEKWGGPNQNVWFRHRFTVPPGNGG